MSREKSDAAVNNHGAAEAASSSLFKKIIDRVAPGLNEPDGNFEAVQPQPVRTSLGDAFLNGILCLVLVGFLLAMIVFRRKP